MQTISVVLSPADKPHYCRSVSLVGSEPGHVAQRSRGVNRLCRAALLAVVTITASMAVGCASAGNRIPLLGEQLPHMEVDTTKGRLTLPDHYHNHWFILFSHPGDFTPVCTTEFAAFEHRIDDFHALDCKLIGLSVDPERRHQQWITWIRENVGASISFPIIADEQGQAAMKLGMRHPVGGMMTVRAVFIVDPEGTIRAIIYYPPQLGRNLDEIVRAVRALQLADRYHASTPANWPDNEIVGDHLVGSKKSISRLPDYVCLDEWFCHAPIPEEPQNP